MLARKMRRIWNRKTAALAVALFTALGSGNVQAMPENGSVKAGSANISQSGNTMDIQQNTSKVAIDWTGFDIHKQETVNFHQPDASSVALNRVLSNSATEIYGNLNANGRVFLINPNGVLFGQGAEVNVGGLVASTRDISNENFMKGDYTFSGNSDAAVINAGTIKAEGGVVALLARDAENTGSILTKGGSTVLAAGSNMKIDYEGDGKINLNVNAAAVNAKVLNSGSIKADGGYVVMTARDASNVLNTVVNNSGTIEAKSLKNVNGTILLDGGEQGVVQVGGSIDASGDEAGQTGGNIKAIGKYTNVTGSLKATGDQKGGLIETSGDVLSIADEALINASSANGKAGEWLLDPLLVVINENGKSTAGKTSSIITGNTAEAVPNIDAAGNTDVTLKYDHYHNDYFGYKAGYTTTYLSAKRISDILAKGTNITVTAAANETQVAADDKGNATKVTYSGNVADIWVEAPITGGQNATLTLNASRTIKVDAPITGTNGSLNVVLHADTNADSYGVVMLNNTINTNGGSFTSATGTDLASGRTGTYVTVAKPLITNGGNIILNGDLWLATGGLVAFSNGTGRVSITGNVASAHTYSYVVNTNKSGTSGNIWQTAEDDAERNGGYLATITSAMENSIISSQVPGGKEVYVGAKRVSKDTEKTSVWEWVNHEGEITSNSFSFWNTNEDNKALISSERQSYMAIGYAAAAKWDDVGSASLNSYIVERDIGLSTLSYDTPAGTDTLTPYRPQLDYLNTNNTAGNGAYSVLPGGSGVPGVDRVAGLTSAELPFFKVAAQKVYNYGTYDVSETPEAVKLEPSAKRIPEPEKKQTQYRSLDKELALANGEGRFNLSYDGSRFNIYPIDGNARALLAAGDAQKNTEVASKALYTSFNEMGLVLEDLDAIYVHMDPAGM